ncbi:AraC family transcriptional regulator [Konateibacter massiliensis]|uniref:AraC family transcriptional regulator n=1 Tax=Konateibacter massiliensis TaxID=2002841 RepID=UPI000C144CF0|nr:AraC family transcriptional regulator [Konateibacter massiliensis]
MNNNSSIFTQKEIAAALQIWNRAAISLLDIRHNLISPNEPLQSYRLPASAFVYAGGGAELSLNDTVYSVDRFGLFHGGKGTELSIHPTGNWLEYYMVLYKATEPSVHRRQYARLLEQVNPFQQHYGFAPENPLFFAEQLRRMFEKWSGPTPLNLFYGKTAFYQLVYEVYEELDRGKVSVFEPDIIVLAQKYLNTHYDEALSIQNMREVLGISNSHFHRLFTARTGQSPQEYLINLRLAATKKYLSDTNCTLREIATKCGFSDELSLMRMFRKHEHMTTTQYRDICTSQMGDAPIDNLLSFPYNWESLVSLDKLKGKGETFMFKQMRSKAVVAAALSLMLLMSACGTTPVNTNSDTSAPTTSITAQTSTEEETRIISTEKGDVEITGTPERIVANYYYGELLALGAMPVGIGSWMPVGSTLENKLDDAQKIETWEAETIMALEPDVIITSSEKDYEKLSKVAPVVYLNPSNNMTALERMLFLAEVLNTENGSQTATDLIQTYDEKAATAKKQLESTGVLDKTITIIVATDYDNIMIIGTGWVNYGANIIYNDLGMNMPEKLQQTLSAAGATYMQNVSMEMLPEYCGDIVMHINYNEDTDVFADDPVFQNIPAVKEGRYFQVANGYMFYSDILSSTEHLDYITKALAELPQ